MEHSLTDVRGPSVPVCGNIERSIAWLPSEHYRYARNNETTKQNALVRRLMFGICLQAIDAIAHSML